MTAIAARPQTLQIGDIEVSWLPDGVHHVQGPSHYPATAASVFDQHPEVLDADGWLVMSVGGVLVRTPDANLLIDAGAGPVHISMGELTGGRFHGDLIGGELLVSLRRHGLAPADIDAVAITHMHNDHMGWVSLPGGGATFGNARYRIDAAEWAFWSQPEQIGTPAGAHPDQIEVFESALDLFAGDAEIVPGVRSFPTPGHTPGHTSYLIGSEGSSALVLGDAFHCPVELVHAGMEFVFDQDVPTANESRRRLEQRLLEPDTWFVGGHFPTRIFGQLRHDGAHPHLHYRTDESAVSPAAERRQA